MKKLGLIGKSLKHSFSKTYFEEKFKSELITDYIYNLYELPKIDNLPELIAKENLIGLNVTIPYKESILPFLTDIDENALKIGAVNVLKIDNKNIKGFNTDYIGFKQSLAPFIKPIHERALILGTGGASKAIVYALEQIGIHSFLVSRKPKANELGYEDLNEYVLKHHKLIINTTPVGMYPNTNDSPAIPYEYLTSEHICYDLIYNPSETMFLKKSKEKGAATFNGMEMLKIQAEKSWEIWTKES